MNQFRLGLNRVSLHIIESAAFVLSLDDEPFEFDINKPEKLDKFGSILLHGKGCDRWFDKSFTVCVGSNGRVIHLFLTSLYDNDNSIFLHFSRLVSMLNTLGMIEILFFFSFYRLCEWVCGTFKEKIFSIPLRISKNVFEEFSHSELTITRFPTHTVCCCFTWKQIS